MRHALLASLAAVLVVGDRASAQQFYLPPSETISVTDGFDARTTVVEGLVAPGAEDAATACGSAVSQAAQLYFFYTAGAHTLSITASAQEPVTLLIFDPAGQWHCAPENSGPSIAFELPRSGRYALWIGSLGPTGAVSVTMQEHEMPARQ